MWKILITIACFSATISAAIMARAGHQQPVPRVPPVISETETRCPNGFQKIETDCYHFSKKKANWDTANENCQAKNSTLAVPPNLDIGQHLRNYLLTPGLQDLERWTGVRYNPISHAWVEGITGKKVAYYGFGRKRLKKNLDWNCAAMTRKWGYHWVPRRCHKRRHYVCHISLDPPKEVSDVTTPGPPASRLTVTDKNMRDTTKPQDTNPPPIKTNSNMCDPTKPQANKPFPPKKCKISKQSTVEGNEKPPLNYKHQKPTHVRKSRLATAENELKKESRRFPKIAAIASQNGEENREKPFTENYRISPRTPAAKSSSRFEINRHPNVDSFQREV